MKTKALIVALLAAVSARSLAAVVPAIRYTSEAPFRDGKPVESVWNSADRIGGFVTCLTLDTPTWDTEARIEREARHEAADTVRTVPDGLDGLAVLERRLGGVANGRNGG